MTTIVQFDVAGTADVGGQEPTIFDIGVVINGQAGYFAHSLNAYGRGGQPCPRCGRAITRVSFMNRSSHFCPHCQRMPPAA